MLCFIKTMNFVYKHYRFLTFEGYCSQKSKLDAERFVVLRHDVDLRAANSLATAKIEQSLGIAASYYFRVVKQSVWRRRASTQR